jgi:hypothetical protein
VAEIAGHRGVVDRMVKQLTDAGLPLKDAREQATAAAQRYNIERAGKRATFIRKQNTPKR